MLVKQIHIKLDNAAFLVPIFNISQLYLFRKISNSETTKGV